MDRRNYLKSFQSIFPSLYSLQSGQEVRSSLGHLSTLCLKQVRGPAFAAAEHQGSTPVHFSCGQLSKSHVKISIYTHFRKIQGPGYIGTGKIDKQLKS